MWPDYMTRETLAKRLDMKPGYLDQLVKRGCLPQPRQVGEALLWAWVEVDTFIRNGKTAEVIDDPYVRGVHAAKASPTRPHGAQSGR